MGGGGGWKIYKKYGTTLPMSRLGEVTQKTRLPCKPTGIRSEDFTKHFELQTGAKAALRRDQSERGNNKAPSFPPR